MCLREEEGTLSLRMCFLSLHTLKGIIDAKIRNSSGNTALKSFSNKILLKSLENWDPGRAVIAPPQLFVWDVYIKKSKTCGAPQDHPREMKRSTGLFGGVTTG